MKKKITYKVVGFWEDFCFEKSLVYTFLKDKFEFQESDHPEYLFYGPFNDDHLQYDDAVKIFVTGESIAPDFNFCDYALGFENLSFGDRYLRYPVYLFYDRIGDACKVLNINCLHGGGKFCSWVVSNNAREQITIDLYNAISAYKHVDCGGRYLNNMGNPDGVADKLVFLREYRFNLAFENSSHAGYTTEKIMDSFAAGTVPIYWGDPEVARYINPAAFIDITGCDAAEAVRRIREIDEDEEKYRAMLTAAPKFVQKEYEPKEMLATMLRFMEHIFEQPKESAYRRNTGPHRTKHYYKLVAWKQAYDEQSGKNKSLIKRIKRKIKTLFKI